MYYVAYSLEFEKLVPALPHIIIQWQVHVPVASFDSVRVGQLF